MEIKHKESEEAGVFYIEVENQKPAEIQYVLEKDDRLIIQHTFVPESLSGKGIGKLLVDKTVLYAREHHLKVVPVCSFAKKIMEDDTYQDVLY
ncbi:MAG: N-acetyltransferase [Opitutaceae bacterium]|nr:N-acetyltransferase [Cytophagales bacterium]